jgi:DUF438 domain-containing protein
MLPTGNVSLEQLVGIFGTLPLDLTFVDADDRVAFRPVGALLPRRPADGFR